jgi:hypothetical protein
MTNPFSEYVALLGDIEQIPVAARELPSFPREQRAATMTRVVELVRARVLPQSDLEEAGRDALLDDRATPTGAPRAVCDTTDHEAILAPVDELAHADPRDGARVQELLYRLHAAIAGHFGEAELILAASVVETPPRMHRMSSGALARSDSGIDEREDVRPSRWFG